MLKIKIQSEVFEIEKEITLLKNNNIDIGAVSSFIGYVRAKNTHGTIKHLELEHYPAMTENAIAKIVQKASTRWQLIATTVIHRIGLLKTEEPIVLVLSASKHRLNAIKSCHFIIDYLKNQAPFWKKETTIDGRVSWVENRESDFLAQDNW